MRAVDLDEGLKAELERGEWSGQTLRFAGNEGDAAVGGFTGAYVENLFQERRELQLELRTSTVVRSPQTQSAKAAPQEPESAPGLAGGKSADRGAAAWYCARLRIPFVGLPELQPDINRHLY